MSALETARLDQECFDQGLEVLREGLSPKGFLASPSTEHYAGIWARDAAITMLGANLSGDPSLLDGSRRTLNTLLELQTGGGQVPNAVWPGRSYWDWGEAGSVDATALIVIAAAQYYRITQDKAFLDEQSPRLTKAIRWLHHLDVSNFGLLDTPPASDWIDSSLWRFGKVFYINALYYQALRSVELLELPLPQSILPSEEIRKRVDMFFWPRQDVDLAEFLTHLDQPGRAIKFPHTASQRAYEEAASADRNFYVSHATFGAFADVCDVLANCMAVIFGIGNDDQAARILDFLADSKIAEPFPVRVLAEPISAESDRWQMLNREADRHQAPQWRNPPYQFHNAGVWPFVGGFYVMALHTAGRTDDAGVALTELALANRQGPNDAWTFHEWLDGRTGKPGGAERQLWSAGTFVAAFQMLKGTDLGLGTPSSSSTR